MKKAKIKFSSSKLTKALIKPIVNEQTELFAEYAENKIRLLGDAIQLYNSKHHMDRTGNLLNSLCWGVSYEGRLRKFGFYREETLKPNGIGGGTTSYLHEWMSGDVKYLLPVNGRELAVNYLQTYGNNGSRGWKVFFAILAPYWGYWEKGFTQVHGFSNKGGFMGATFQKFSVMTEFFDVVRKDLKPARTRFRVSVAKYNREKLESKWRKYAGL